MLFLFGDINYVTTTSTLREAAVTFCSGACVSKHIDLDSIMQMLKYYQQGECICMTDTQDKFFKKFYRRVLHDLLSEGKISLETKIMVLCGGRFDVEVLNSMGFENVTISNLASYGSSLETASATCKSTVEDASAISLPDNSVEIAIVHSGLHHLPCPQQAISEMYRIASLGIIAFEPAENAFTRLGICLGLGQEYETEAVAANKLTSGGVNDTPIPNYVYRFSRKDVTKCIQACAPIARHRIRFWHATRIQERLFNTGPALRKWVLRLCAPLMRVAGASFFCLANNMAFFVEKPRIPEDLLPWLEMTDSGITPNRKFFER